jgi:hypothetical protein
MLSKNYAVAATFHTKYIDIAADTEVVESIEKNTKAFKRLLKTIPPKKRNYAYAAGKWTVQQLLQHLIDTERVFSYRALSFARKDPAALPGFDENNWATQANKTIKEWNNLVEEFKAVRKSTTLLFKSFNKEELLQVGKASNHPINPLAVGYIIAGHLQYHMAILEERYLTKKK